MDQIQPDTFLVSVKGLLEHSVSLHLSIHYSCLPATEPELRNTMENGSLQSYRKTFVYTSRDCQSYKVNTHLPLS